MSEYKSEHKFLNLKKCLIFCLFFEKFATILFFCNGTKSCHITHVYLYQMVLYPFFLWQHKLLPCPSQCREVRKVKHAVIFV
jgi:hypothetical protein